MSERKSFGGSVVNTGHSMDRIENWRKPRTDTERLDALEKAGNYASLHRNIDSESTQLWVFQWEIWHKTSGPTLRAAIDAFMDAEKKEGG